MLAVNYVLLRRAIEPLRRLTRGDADGRSARARGGAPTCRRGRRRWRELGAAFDQMLERLESERRESARRALAAQEEERLRIARELHDEVGQALTAVLLQLDRAQRGRRGAGGADRARRGRRRGRRWRRCGRSRATCGRRRSTTSGWRRRCGSCATRRSAPGVQVEREIAADVRLAPEVEVVVYRVAQEAITNVLRHAARRAARVCVLERTASGAGLRGHRRRPWPRGRAGGLRAAGDARACGAGGRRRSRSARPPAGGTLVTLRVP